MRSVVGWITAALALSVVFASIYVVAQNAQRQWADDAPLRLASQIAPDPLTYAETHQERVELGSSLGSFWVLYDADGKAIAGSGYLAGKLAHIPDGVLDVARETGSNSVSWQPGEGLRFATIEVGTDHGVLMTGQSLAPSEGRTESMGLLVAIGWAASILVVLAGFGVSRLLQRETTASV
jgi:hypothetical protein